MIKEEFKGKFCIATEQITSYSFVHQTTNDRWFHTSKSLYFTFQDREKKYNTGFRYTLDPLTIHKYSQH